MNTVAESYQPKLRADSFFIPGPDGTYFHNVRGWYKLTPKIPYALVERVLPFLNGIHSAQAITQNLNDVQRKAVNYVLQELSDHGFVRDGSSDPEILRESLAKTYQSELAFLEALGETPVLGFQNFRQARVLIDAPILLESVLGALWGLGLRVGHVMNGDETLKSIIKARQEIDDEQTAIAQAELEAVTLGDYGLVVQIGSDLSRAHRLAERCAVAKVPLIQAVMLDQGAWIQLPRSGGHDPLSFWERSNLKHQLLNPETNTLGQSDWLDSRGMVIANILAQHAFRFLASKIDADSVFFFERFSLEGTKHRSAPHMIQRMVRPRSLEEAVQDFQILEQTVCVSEEEFSRRAAQLIDPRLGVLSELDEHDFQQIPLNVTEAIARDARHHDQSKLRAYGVGTDFSTPRVRASKRVLELYAATAFDVRLFSGQGDDLEIWSLNLSTQRPELVSAQLAFPTLNGVSPATAMPGLASGMTWEEAVQTALTKLLVHRSRSRLGRVALHVSKLDLNHHLTDALAMRYYSMLGEMQVEVVVGVLLEESPISQFIAFLNEQPIAITANADPQLALRELLEHVLQHQQSLLHNEPAYQIAPITDWVAPIWLETHPLPDTKSEATSPLIGFFEQSGCQPHVVSLDHDPALQSTGLFVVHAILLERAS
jgi:hypothetical protein